MCVGTAQVCYVCRYDAEFEKSYLKKMRMKVEQHCYVHVC